jgi:single-stranded-DNA-specific exonuclease
MDKLWVLNKVDEAKSKQLSRALDISITTASLLVGRGILEAKEGRRFLRGGLEALYSPYELKGIKKAVVRINKALENKEKIIIYGDYDVDGITSTALLYTILSKFTDNLECYIPNRLEEGYDLNIDACDYAKEKKASLMVTVDCGISALKEAQYLKELGIDLIIVDHHQQQDELPFALSIIDPHQKRCKYPFKHLAGVGVVFKLLQAFLAEHIERPLEYLRPHLDLVALGTISDVVPLIDENRILIKEGLKQLNQTNKIGLKALIKRSSLGEKEISAYHVGFILGPRINAAGRIGSADASLQLLLTENEEEAIALAKLLNDGNKQRQNIQNKTFKEALLQIEKNVNFKDHNVIVLCDEWHPGVVGIVASKIVDKFYRPAIMISTKEEPAKGSGRSIDNFHLLDALKQCSGCLTGFGGHKKACGVILDKDKIDTFRKEINQYAKDVIVAENLTPNTYVDLQVKFSDININFLKELKLLEPYGMDNPKPVLMTSNLHLRNEPFFMKKNGVKILVTDGKITHEALGFSLDDINFKKLYRQKFSMIYYPTIDSYRGRDYICLRIIDIKGEE